MEIASLLHIVKTPYFEIYTSSYLIAGDRLTLIDTGQPESWDQDIKPYIESIGRRPSELAQVVLTHHHDDHSGSVRQIRKETGATIAVSGVTAAYLQRPPAVMEWETSSFEGWLSDEERRHILEGTDYGGTPRDQGPPMRVDRTLAEGDTIDAPPLTLRVLAAPGHTPDSIALFDEGQRLLFTGDTVSGHATVIDDLPIVQMREEFLRTIARFADLKPRMILSAHPYLPLADAVVTGRHVGQMLQATTEMQEQIRASVVTVLWSASGPMTTAEIAGIVCRMVGPRAPAPRSHGTVRLNLVLLRGEGIVTAEHRGDQVTWALARERIGTSDE
jgi:glyoxylase-like metal-dependent hydrolase (beta-lactamase superfamily II)